jgi:hypothetical protein
MKWRKSSSHGIIGCEEGRAPHEEEIGVESSRNGELRGQTAG